MKKQINSKRRKGVIIIILIPIHCEIEVAPTPSRLNVENINVVQKHACSSEGRKRSPG